MRMRARDSHFERFSFTLTNVSYHHFFSIKHSSISEYFREMYCIASSTSTRLSLLKKASIFTTPELLVPTDISINPLAAPSLKKKLGVASKRCGCRAQKKTSQLARFLSSSYTKMEFRSSDEPQQLLDHLHKTPGLTRLDMELMDMNDVEGKKIGEAVAALESLETLVLKLDAELDEEKKSSPESLWPMDAFLTAAFLGENPNSSVRSLIIAGSGTDGDIMRLGLLPRVIEQVPLKELVFKWHGDDGAAPEEMHVLLDALVENNSIESLTLPNLVRWDFPDNADNGFIDGEIFAKIVELVKKKTTSIQKMLLHIGECRGKGADTVNLDAFYGALSSNSSLRSLTLKGPFYTPIAETQFPTWIRNTTSLKELLLEGDGDDSEVPKILFQALGENKSLTRLEMEDFFIEDEEVEELLKALKVNSTLQEIIFEPKCDREEEVQEALAKNHQVQL